MPDFSIPDLLNFRFRLPIIQIGPKPVKGKKFPFEVKWF